MASSISDLTRQKALAWAAFWKLEKIRRSSSISLATKIRLFKATCVTVLLYGCESWVLSVNMENKINAFATSCYRIMLNIKRLNRVSNARIHEMTNTQPLVNTVRQRQLRFLGHILRMPDDEPCKRYALCVSTHGRRRPGRQRTIYISYIQKLQRGYRKWSAFRCNCLASFTSLFLEKICSRLLRSRMMMMMMMQVLNRCNIAFMIDSLLKALNLYKWLKKKTDKINNNKMLINRTRQTYLE